MKNLALILIVNLLLFNGFSQDIPKGANVVQIESDSLVDIELFKAGVNMLKTFGYAFDRIYTDFLVCSTKPFKSDKGEMEYWIDLSVTGNRLQIRSYVKTLGTTTGNSGIISGNTENAWERGANRSLAVSLWRYGWDKQVFIGNQIALFYQGKVSYFEDKQ